MRTVGTSQPRKLWSLQRCSSFSSSPLAGCLSRWKCCKRQSCPSSRPPFPANRRLLVPHRLSLSSSSSSSSSLSLSSSLLSLKRSFSSKASPEDTVLRENSQDSLKKAVLRAIAEDPVFLRDVLRGVRHHEEPEVLRAADLLSEYIMKADVNRDGVISAEELRHWMRRKSHLVASGRKYYPQEESSASSSSSSSSLSLSPHQIHQHVIKCAIPFIGFGFLDNAIMIVSGSEIETFFGATLGISAMAAAGFGNTLSDVVGIQAGGVVEALSDKLGIKDPELTQEQLKSKFVRFLTTLASMLGITIGCLLGMFPLLFIDDDQDKHLKALFDAVDADKSGHLDMNELDSLFGKLSAAKLIENPEEAHNFMRSCGFDDQDSINFKEFKELFYAYIQKKTVDKHAEERKLTRTSVMDK